METVKKVFKFIFFPLIILALIVKFASDFLLGQSNKSMKEAKKKDQDLLEKQRQADIKSQLAKEEANKIGEEIKKIEESDIDLDWHKKQK